MADRGASMKARAKRLTSDEASTGIPMGGSGGVNTKQAGAKPKSDEFAEIRGSTKAQKRLDKFARGGKVKGKTNVNIVIAQHPQQPQQQAAPMPMPMPHPAAPPPPPPGPPPGAGAPPGMGAPAGGPTIVMPPGGAGGPPGMPPQMPGKAGGGRVGMYKRGGIVGKEMGGAKDSTGAVKKELKMASPRLTKRASGGAVDKDGDSDDGFKKGGHVKHHAAPHRAAKTNMSRRFVPMGPPPPASGGMGPAGDSDGDEMMAGPGGPPPMGPPPGGPPMMKKGGRACRASGGSVMRSEPGTVDAKTRTYKGASGKTYPMMKDGTYAGKGGRAAADAMDEGDAQTDAAQAQSEKDNPQGYKRGGMTAGRGSGLGRMQAARNQKGCD